MKKISTKTTSLFAVTLAALLVTGCLEEKPKDDDNNDNGDPNTEEPDFYEEKGWHLVFADEFEGTVIDDSKWAFEVNCWGGGNNEKQCYVDGPDNAFVEDGKLHIKAIRGEHTGAVHNPDSAEYDPAETQTQPFTSARLRSVAPNAYVEGEDTSFSFKNDWKYGRFEIRAKLPSGQGTWPAVWMLPTDWEFGGWAMSGEIDIVEAVNLKADRDLSAEDNDETGVIPENRVHGTLHYGRAWPGNVYTGVEYDFGDVTVNPADGFHTYAVEWEEGAIRWFVDDIHVSTQTQEGWYTHYQDESGVWQTSGTTAAPFNQKFHLIMNLAMGGAWAGNVNEGGIDDSISEAEMVVDYVRVYQCEDDASGVTCGTKGAEGTYTLQSGVVEPMLPVAADFTADPLVIFSDLLVGDWQMAKWDDADGGDEYSVVEPTDSSDGYIDLEFSNTGVMYLYSNEGKLDDFSNYAGDYSFKIRWVDGTATGLKVGISDDKGNFAHIVLDQQYFGVSGSDQWTSVTIPMTDMITNAPALDLSRINIAGKFEQVGGTDLHVQIKDIVVSKGTYVPVEPEGYGYQVVLSEADIAEGFTADLYHGYLEAATDTISVESGVINGTHVGGGNISLKSTSGALDLSDFVEGSLNFDLRIVDMGTATDVLIKMDTGTWPNVGDVALSETATGLPVDSNWASFSIDVADFIANDNRLDGSGVFDITTVLAPIVVEAFGGGDLQVEIRNVNLTRPLIMSSDSIAEGFTADLYHGYLESSTDTISVVDGVINGTHVGGGNISLKSTSGALDLTDFSTGSLNFDLRIIDMGTATDVLIKMDTGTWPNVGDVALSETTTGLPTDSNWAAFSIDVADFIANNNRLDGSGVFDVSNVLAPIVVEAFGGGDIQVEIRNVNLSI
ncbi:family 16 glycosylhydrolase [Reinekea sp. G2M2-21]|uniref:glycoside hydrolase family 16 protein n=1 Tax=Reinekea sp. G2M2-21 TaxID=2788942 RepID=UPI0018AA914C|nr:glycoside hydrolase family 16 protein [Reinekea sp. G2M2-21]